MAHDRAGAIRPVQAPLMLLPVGIPCQAREGREVGGRQRPCVMTEQPGAGDQALRAFGQPLDDEIALLERWETHADGDVYAFAQHIHPSVGAFKHHLDLRATGHEAGDHFADLEVKDR
ncbi:hypothetical protein D9M70_629150 [compost metagenome]